MEENRMRNNPYDEPTADIPSMEELPPRQVPNTPPASEEIVHPAPEEEIEELRREEAQAVKFAIGKLNDYLSWFALVLEVILALRLLLKLIGADQSNLFAGFLYALTDIILFPFSNIVRSSNLGVNQAVSTLLGMLVYALVFWALRRFLHIVISRPEEPIE